MLIIDCPWCGKRPEIEFRYGFLIDEAAAAAVAH